MTKQNMVVMLCPKEKHEMEYGSNAPFVQKIAQTEIRFYQILYIQLLS